MKKSNKSIIGILILVITLLFGGYSISGCSIFDKVELPNVEIPNQIENTTTEVNNEIPDNLKEVSLVRVVDGDTLVVNDGTKDFKVRLIGIDTPESVHPDQNKNSEQGKSASEHTKNVLFNYKTIYLEYDVSQYDKYNRDLCYVWLTPNTSNLENMLNYKLIKDGYAVAKAYKPNIAHKQDFEDAQKGN